MKKECLLTGEKTPNLLRQEGGFKNVSHLDSGAFKNDGSAEIPIGSQWINQKNGDVYVGSNGNVWSRPASDWHRSMTPKGEF